MKLYVVRHGETVWNKLHKVQGAADIPLAPNGILLAEKTGEALKDVRFDLASAVPLREPERRRTDLDSQAREVPVIEDKRSRKSISVNWRA